MVADFHRASAWSELTVVVVGFDEAGAAACDNLLFLGARVLTLTESLAGADTERVELLRTLGATIEETPAAELPGCDLVVLGGPSELASNLVAQAEARGVPVWGEVELAWRLRAPEHPVPWLVVASSEQTARTVQMLVRVLRCEGLEVRVAGASGAPFVESLMDPDPADVVVAECDAWQLRYVHSLSAQAAVVVQAESGPDYLGRAYEQAQLACVYNVMDPTTRRLVEEADVVEGARAVGITWGMPSISMFGLVEDILVDRAFIPQRESSAAELCTVADLPDSDPATVRDALAAAALARAHGVSQKAVRDGLRSLRTTD